MFEWIKSLTVVVLFVAGVYLAEASSGFSTFVVGSDAARIAAYGITNPIAYWGGFLLVVMSIVVCLFCAGRAGK